jgi:hypothetical protein
MTELEARDPAMFNVRRDVECLFCAFDKIIKELAIIAEIILLKYKSLIFLI